MTDSAANNPVLTFEGKRYDLNTLPDELKELVRGMQVADAQLRMHEDTLKVLAVGRQSLATVQEADRIVVLEKGAVVDRGTHDELMQRGGRYRELCERQFIRDRQKP